jgi:hypothetical protein
MYRREDFQEGLSSEKRKYPIQKFRAFWSATKRYAELTKSDSLIHKSVAATTGNYRLSRQRSRSYIIRYFRYTVCAKTMIWERFVVANWRIE